MKTAAPLILLSTLIAFAGSQEPQTGIRALYRGFQDPPREFTVRPFWFWNGKLDAKEIEWQIQQMVDQGVYGAYVHNRTGLETPYLSEEYFDAVRAAFKKSREIGFLFGVVDDYEWPSGEARDVWLRGLPSRVIAADPEFRMRSLGYVENSGQGPSVIETDSVEHPVSAVAFRTTGENTLDPESLTDVSASISGGRVRWNAPAGNWTVIIFYLHTSQGRDGGLVDLLNAAATRKFLDLSYEEYYRRFGEYFGTIMDSTYVDHEGDYGHRIAWTPRLFDAFREMKGYDLKKELPLLFYDGGRRTPKVRCDYLDVVSELYYRSFFKQVTDWCEAHKIKITGHVWEENLHMEAAFDGDLQRIMRGWAWPGVDSLWDKGRLPRDFKVTASVAHFRGTRFTCENQGLQGADSYLDFQKMRLGTNMIAAWGASSLIPHAFNYSRRRIEFPPDWFYHQPYWKYFRHYADYARRLSFMNDGGAHVADILVFQPTESAWAHTEPVFSSKSAYIPSKWNNPLDAINDCYTQIMNRLAQERWDYDVADSHHLNEATIRDRKLVIGNESYRVLILPPVTTIRRETLSKIAAFYDAGGIVIGTKFLPDASMDEGRDDPAIKAGVEHIFGSTQPAPSAARTNATGGKSFFVKEDAAETLQVLNRNLTQDVRVIDGRKENLFYLHRLKEGIDFYWMVNDSGEARDNTVLFRSKGIAERWDASDASRSRLFWTSTPAGTEVRLHFEPWDAYYVIFSPRLEAEQPVRILRTNLADVSLLGREGGTIEIGAVVPQGLAKSYFVEIEDEEGSKYRGSVDVTSALPPLDLADGWRFRPSTPAVAAPYAFMHEDPAGEGLKLGWQAKNIDTSDWSWTWLSRERLTVKDWWVAGPFPNIDHRGFGEEYAPEKAVDPKAEYALPDGTKVRWTRFSAANYTVAIGKAVDVPRSRNWVTAYAATYVHSPSRRIAYFRVAADNSAKLWVNGRNLLDWHIHPFYYEMREDFALTRSAELQAGWNEILLKVSKCAGAAQYGFILRVTDADGRNFDDLVFSPEKTLPDKRPPGSQAKPTGGIWYRIPVPVSAVGVRLPPLKGEVDVYYNAVRLKPGPHGIVTLPEAAEEKDGVLVLRTAQDAVIGDSPQFLLGEVKMELGSWTTGGLPYYSGSAEYERAFDLPREYVGGKLILDCGQVGAVAEVRVNEKLAGVRVWLPYTFDISDLVRPGSNVVKILVTNTMENARAVENHAGKLQKIQLNGLLGPVKILPYLETTIRCNRR